MRFLTSSSAAVLLAGLSTLLGLADAQTAGCGKSPPSSGTKYMTVNGRQREYILQVPANYNPSTSYKLIFGFHWLDGNMQAVAPGYYGLRDLAKETAIFVAPNGLNRGWANSGGEDIRFTEQIVSEIKNSMCVDESQVFATGWSYGGAMSHSVACSLPDTFAAVAVISGAQLSGCSGGNKPVPYLHMHGISDNVLPINLGRQLRDKWIGTNGCAAKNAPEPNSGSGTHIKTEYSCSSGSAVTWIAFDGGHQPDPRDRNGGYWAPGETWSFFMDAVDGGTGNPGTPTTTTARPSTTTTTPPTNTGGGNCSGMWGQCGGIGWSGATCCSQGTCKYSNDWYSQCV